MKNVKIIVLILFAAFTQQGKAQQVVLEKVRCFSAMGPVMSYWRSEEVKRNFIKDLSQSLQKHQQLQLKEAQQPNIELLVNASGASTTNPTFTDTSAGTVHLYLDVYEVDLNSFFSYVYNNAPDSNLRKKTISAILLRSRIFDRSKKLIHNEELYVAVARGESPGIGLEYNSLNTYGRLPASPRGFSGLVSKGLDIMLDPKNENHVVEMQVAPAYVGDNYILGRTTGIQRVFVNTQKGVSKYMYNGKVEMFRLGPPLYEEIKTTGKKAQVYPPVIMNVMRNARNAQTSEFVFLRQDGRDVVRDKSYLVKMMVQIDPEFSVSGPKSVLTNFIPDPVHYLLLDTDTIAVYNIRKNVLNEEGKKLYLNQVSNGSELNSMFRLDNGAEWTVRYNYVITGKIGQKNFRIVYTGGDNSLKEFYIDGKLACIAEGATELKKFIAIDTTLDAVFLNQLFVIGFNAFTD